MSQSIDFSNTGNSINQSYSRLPRPSLDISITSNDQMNSSMHYLNTTPEFSMSTTPRYDGPKYQNQRLMNYNNQVAQNNRSRQPQSYVPSTGQQPVALPQSNKTLPAYNEGYQRTPNVVPPSYDKFNVGQMSMPRNSARKHYNQNMNKLPPTQTEFYQGGDNQNTTLRQSLNLLKMAANMNQRNMNSGSFTNMHPAPPQPVPMHDPRMMGRGYGQPMQSFNPPSGYYPPPSGMAQSSGMTPPPQMQESKSIKCF